MKRSRVIVLTALVLLVIGILVVRLHHESERELVFQFQQYQELHAHHIAGRIESFLWSKWQALEAIATDAFLADDMCPSFKEFQRIVQVSSEKMENRYIKGISLYDKTGMLIFSTDSKEIGMGGSQHDLMIWAGDPVNRGKVFVHPLFPDIPKDGSEPKDIEHFSAWVLLATPIYNALPGRQDSKKPEVFSGVLSTVIDLKEFLADESNDSGMMFNNVWIMETEGDLLFHSRHPEMVLRNVNHRDKRCDQCHVSFGYVEKILKERRGTADYEMRNSRKKITAFAPVDLGNAHWIAVVDSDYGRVTSVIRRSLRDHLILLGIVVLALVGSSLQLSRYSRSRVKAEEETKHWKQIVAERDNSEKTLRKSEERYRTLVETMTDGLAVQDGNGMLTYVNKRFCEMLGYGVHELVGQPLDSFIHVSDPRIFEDQKSKQEGAAYESCEIAIRRKTGDEAYGLMSRKSISDSDGDAGMSFSVVTDITRRKQMEKELKDSWEQLKLLSSRILTSQETERKRITAELHDELGGMISGLRFKLGRVERKLGNDQIELQKECKESLYYLDQVIAGIRRICRDLSPSVLEDVGLAGGLRWLVDNFQKLYGIEVVVDAVEIDHLFSKRVQLAIYRVFQEALANIGKHAQAKNVRIGAKEKNETVSFSIEDDGKGFDVEQVLIRDSMEGGLGLAIMQERVRMLQGTFELLREEGKGTKITFSIPIEGEAEPGWPPTASS